jgi:hypothetical protein
VPSLISNAPADDSAGMPDGGSGYAAASNECPTRAASEADFNAHSVRLMKRRSTCAHEPRNGASWPKEGRVWCGGMEGVVMAFRTAIGPEADEMLVALGSIEIRLFGRTLSALDCGSVRFVPDRPEL